MDEAKLLELCEMLNKRLDVLGEVFKLQQQQIDNQEERIKKLEDKKNES